MIQIIVDSLIAGSVYMVMALGIVAVFKTTRVFNFAHGQMAAFGGYIAYAIANKWHVPFIVLALAGAAAGAAVALLSERLILARLYQRSVLELVVATFGISLILRALIQRIWGFEPKNIPSPFSGDNVHLVSVTFSAYGALVICIAIGIVVLLSVILNATTVGLELRATFDDPVAGRLAGVRVARIRSAAWLLGGALAGLGGVLLTPLVYLSPDTMDQVLIVAFAAAVVGGLTSFYGAVIGGVIVAFASNLFANYVSLDYRDVLVYSSVLLFLWLRPQGLLGEVESESSGHEGEPSSYLARLSGSVTRGLATRASSLRQTVLRGYAPQWILVAVVVASFFLAPHVFGREYQLSLTTWLTQFIAVAGLAITAFYAGRISLAQTVFMAIGAYSMPHLLHGRPGIWPLALIAAALMAGVVGVLFEIPSLRLHGAYYAVATLALALIVPLGADKWRSMTGGVDGIAVPYATWRGSLLDSQTIYYIFACIATLVLALLLLLRNSPIGRSVVAVRDSPHGAASLGLSQAPRRVLAAGLGASLGGLAGAMTAMQNNAVTSSAYGLDSALTLFVATVLAGSMIGGAWGAGVIVLVPVLLKNQPLYATGLFGLILIVTLYLLPRRRDVADVLRLAADPACCRSGHQRSGWCRGARKHRPARRETHPSTLDWRARPGRGTEEDFMRIKPRARMVLATSLVLGVAIATASVASASSSRAQTDPGVDTGSKTVTVGGWQIATGPNASFVATTNAVKALFSYWNARGGVNGWKINYIAPETGGDPARSLQEIRNQIEGNQVFAIVWVPARRRTSRWCRTSCSPASRTSRRESRAIRTSARTTRTSSRRSRPTARRRSSWPSGRSRTCTRSGSRSRTRRMPWASRSPTSSPPTSRRTTRASRSSRRRATRSRTPTSGRRPLAGQLQA